VAGRTSGLSINSVSLTPDVPFWDWWRRRTLNRNQLTQVHLGKWLLKGITSNNTHLCFDSVGLV